MNFSKESFSPDERYQQGIKLFQEGRPEEAARLLTEVLRESESSERWNDWATAQLACRRVPEAEEGYRRALELDPKNIQAAANLGVLLVGLERDQEAIPLLEMSMPQAGESMREHLETVLARCRGRQAERPTTVLADLTPQTPMRVDSPRKRIVITGDVLRPDENDKPLQAQNIQWLSNLCRYPLSLAAEAELETVWWGKGGSLDGEEFFTRNGLRMGLDGWAQLSDTREISSSSANYLGMFYEDALVVGFELPDVMTRLFYTRGIPYLDFVIHPIRYLDDLFFGIRTNVPEMFRVLKEFALAEEYFHLHAGIHQATVGRMASLDLEPDSCLFVGQTPVDRALIENGRVLTVEEFPDQLREIARSCRKIYFKPHPYGSDNERILRFLGTIAPTETIHANIYSLLCQPNIREVVSISSSVLYEAGYFGKKATRLKKSGWKLLDPGRAEFDPQVLVPVYDSFYDPHFWSQLLAGICQVKPCRSLMPARKSNRLRTSLQAFWGYNFLDAEILLHNIKWMGGFDFGGNPNGEKPLSEEEIAAESSPSQDVKSAVPKEIFRHTSPVPGPGVLFHSLVYGGSGYADEGLAVILGLAERGLPVQLEPIGFHNDTRNLLAPKVRKILERLKETRVDLARSVYYQSVPAHEFNLQMYGRWRVGRTMFESDRIPDGWAERCRELDEIWVPSEFNRQTFAASGVPEEKLRVMPAGVDTACFRPGLEGLSLPQLRGFNFLSIFEWTQRKGPDVLLRAYLREFRHDEDVALILKAYPRPDPTEDLLPQLAHFVEREVGLKLEHAPPILLLNGFLPSADVPRLYNTASAFVLPSRGEGYGRPYMEALACELPVIGTRWSGQMDFLTEANSYLVDPVGIVPVPNDVDVDVFAGHCWAEPNAEHLQQQMRRVFSHPEEAHERAVRGRIEMVSHWDWNVVLDRWMSGFERLLEVPVLSSVG